MTHPKPQARSTVNARDCERRKHCFNYVYSRTSFKLERITVWECLRFGGSYLGCNKMPAIV